MVSNFFQFFIFDDYHFDDHSYSFMTNGINIMVMIMIIIIVVVVILIIFIIIITRT
jgi:hypothetical protein